MFLKESGARWLVRQTDLRTLGLWPAPQSPSPYPSLLTQQHQGWKLVPLLHKDPQALTAVYWLGSLPSAPLPFCYCFGFVFPILRFEPRVLHTLGSLPTAELYAQSQVLCSFDKELDSHLPSESFSLCWHPKFPPSGEQWLRTASILLPNSSCFNFFHEPWMSLQTQ